MPRCLDQADEELADEIINIRVLSRTPENASSEAAQFIGKLHRAAVDDAFEEQPELARLAST